MRHRIRAAAIGAAALALMLATGCTRVDTYEAAVKKNAVTGAVAENTYDQGLYHAILRSWTTYDLRERQYPVQGRSEELTALTADQLTIGIDAAYRYRLDRERVRELYLDIGAPAEVHDFVYNTFRSSTRDAVADVAAADILSRERSGIGGRIRQLMAQRLEPRGITMTDFFVRDIRPPPSIREAVEEKLAREQQVQAEVYQTQVIEERANQRRVEAAGIRDAQQIIAESLVGERGRAFLTYEGLQALKEAATGENNLIIAPSEGGVPLMRPITEP
ncbi:MAG: SPFH domain-containing protein [Gemmatimonadota bacterium]